LVLYVCTFLYGCMFAYGCMLCMFLLNFVNYSFLFLCYIIMLCVLVLAWVFLLLCKFRSVYSVSLCCSVYCLCVNVYCAAVLFVCKCILYCCHRVSTCVLLLCKCVLYCCYRVSTQLQLNIHHIFLYLYIYRIFVYISHISPKHKPLAKFKNQIMNPPVEKKLIEKAKLMRREGAVRRTDNTE
jgi:hypothetical protein